MNNDLSSQLGNLLQDRKKIDDSALDIFSIYSRLQNISGNAA